MKKQNKYIYGWKLLVNYGQGWEYELFEEHLSEIKLRRNEYRENCPQYPIKTVRAREINQPKL